MVQLLVYFPIILTLLFLNLGTDVASQQEFTSCLKETLSGLAKNADNLQVIPQIKSAKEQHVVNLYSQFLLIESILVE